MPFPSIADRTRASCQKQKRAVTLSESIKLDWKRVEPTIESVLSRALKQERFFAFLHYILDGKEIGAGPDSALQIQTFPSSISEPHSPNHAEVIQQLHDFSKTLKRPVKTSTMDANTPPSEWRLIIPSLLIKEVRQKWGESNGVGERSDPLGKVLAGFPARSPVNGYGPIEGSVAFVVVLS
ncbi:hypothetical protein Tco_0418738 [Tanacetum coccineum]